MTDTEFAFGPVRGTSGRHGHRPPRVRTRALEARVLALGAAFAVAAALAVAGCSSSNPTKPHSGHTSTTPKTRPTSKCTSSGCAEVLTTLRLPQTTVLYGASCSGIHGSWFFNATEGGASTQLRPSYRLLWSFAGGATTAKPSGVVTIPKTKAATVTLTLSNGKLMLHGVRKPGAPVTATGKISIKLSGSGSSTVLTFTETGLSAAEHTLGLVSPFDAGGHPLVVHVKHVKTLAGC